MIRRELISVMMGCNMVLMSRAAGCRCGRARATAAGCNYTADTAGTPVAQEGSGCVTQWWSFFRFRAEAFQIIVEKQKQEKTTKYKETEETYPHNIHDDSV